MLASVVLQVLVVLCLGIPFFLFERRFAAHFLSYRRVLARDAGALVLVSLLGIPTSTAIGIVESHLPFLTPARPPLFPPWASIPLAIVISDLAMYWTHRLIHTRALWPVHRWHHSPRYMYWLAGGRMSFLQGVVYTLPATAFAILHVPGGAIAAYALFGIVLNHWMHSNLRLKSRWLEAIVVTPRIHHIHHSADPRHHGRNFGSLFSFWDRMFGTFVDPSDVHEPLKFGIPETVPGPRLIVGV
jgi:sterol desaturase/sphingolipid hydroxylase (fatty acid hydroxylase superfamily)